MMCLLSFRIPGPLLLALLLALTGCGHKVKLVNVIPPTRSDECKSDSEPNIAVDPADPRRIVISAFTPCPPFISTTEAPIYFSTNGGHTWYLNCIVPGNNPSKGTHDITVRFAGSSGLLYAGILRGIPTDDSKSSELNILRTSDFTSAMPMTLLVRRFDEDQPYIEADGHGGDHVYIGNNNLHNPDDVTKTSTLDSSPDADSPTPDFATQPLEDRLTCGQDLPPVRPAIHSSGFIYVAYLRDDLGSSCAVGSTNTADLVVVRDDHWGTGGYQKLHDPVDGQIGVRVATGLSISWLGNLGNERVGGQLSIAVDPKDRKKVYVAWGDSADPANFTLHVRRSSDGGETWSTSDLKTVSKATNPALAINDDGRVGFLYQKLVEPGTCKRVGASKGCWETHFEVLKGGTWRDLPHPLANVPDNVGGFPLGDYLHLMTVEDKFYGVFSANNYPDKDNFYPGVKYQRHVDWSTHILYGDRDHTIPVKPSVDPYFFTVDE